MSSEQRKHARYETDVELNFYMPYDLDTKVNYELKDSISDSKKHSGVTQNIAAGGICFRSSQQLDQGVSLRIELILPKSDESIYMEGEVRWSTPVANEEGSFDTGVQLSTVDNKKVEESIYFDEKYKVIWSEALERVLGSFALMNKRYPEIVEEK